MDRTHIGKYRIEALLGKGATASVYRAHDEFNDIDVAIKVFDPRAFDEAGDDLVRTGFFVEAAMLGKLDHPHVVRVFDAVTGPDEYYIVSEFVPGGTLGDYVAKGALMDIEPAIDVIFKCVKALQYLHEHGVVHCDIKPENIFVGDGTEVKIGDFGAASVSGLSISQESAIGSPLYMSPQRLAGGGADLHSDIYSVGVMFYQLLTGKRPFAADNMASLLYQMAYVVPPAVSSLRQGVPAGIDEVVARAIAAEIADRYTTWGQFADDLASLFHSGEGRVRRESLITSSGRFEVLRRLPFFAEFEDAELWEVVSLVEFRRIVEGDVLMREGDLGDDFLVLVEGSARIVKAGKAIDVVTAPTSLGEIAYVMKGSVPRNASAVAIEDGLVARIANADIALLPPVCRSKLERRFLEIFAVRLIDVNRRLSHL